METGEIIDTVTGYAFGFERVLAETGMEVDALEELLLNNNVEACPTCGRYVDSYERVPDGQEEPDEHCENCR